MISKTMYCPKCGHEEQELSTECSSCGIVFESYEKSLLSMKHATYRQASEALSKNDFEKAKILLTDFKMNYPELENHIDEKIGKISKREIQFSFKELDQAIDFNDTRKARKLISKLVIKFPELSDKVYESEKRLLLKELNKQIVSNEIGKAKKLISEINEKYPELNDKIYESKKRLLLIELDKAINDKMLSKAIKLQSQLLEMYPELKTVAEKKATEINYIIGQNEVKKARDMIRSGSIKEARSKLEYIEESLSSHAKEARSLINKLADIETAERIKKDSDLKSHIIRSQAVSVLRPYAKIVLVVSIIVSVIILAAGISMAISEDSPLGLMSFPISLFFSYVIMITALLWWAPIVVLAEMAENLAAIRINSEKQSD